MSTQQPTIIYTLTDEAPLLATSSFLPIVRTFAAPAGINVTTSDISVAARILGEFPECLTEEQRVPDTLAERKPHPLPLQVAAERIGRAAGECTYVGDDERDIQAGRAAGMATVAALWGYRLAGDRPLDWGADALVERPRDLLVPGCWPGVAARIT